MEPKAAADTRTRAFSRESVGDALRWWAGTWRPPEGAWRRVSAISAVVVAIALEVAGLRHAVTTALVGAAVAREVAQSGLTPLRRVSVLVRGAAWLAAVFLADTPEKLGLSDARSVWAVAFVVEATLSFRLTRWSAAWAAVCLSAAAWLGFGR